MASDPHLEWLALRSFEYPRRWRERFKSWLKVGAALCIGWHDVTLTDGYVVYNESLGWPIIEWEPPEGNVVYFEDPLGEAMSFLEWVREGYASQVCFDTVGRVVELARARDAIRQLAGSFNDSCFHLKVEVDSPVAGLPLLFSPGPIRAAYVDGRPYPCFKGSLLVLPLLEPGMVHTLDVEVGDPYLVHVAGIHYKPPFLPRIEDWRLKEGKLMIKLGVEETDFSFNATVALDMEQNRLLEVRVEGAEAYAWSLDNASNVAYVQVKLSSPAELEVLYEPTSTLEANVLSVDGLPVALVEVELDGMAYVTADDGIALFNGLNPGKYLVKVRSQQEVVYEGELELHQGVNGAALVIDAPVHRLSVLVKGVDGVPVMNELVAFESQLGTLYLRTNEEGLAEVFLVEGEYLIYVEDQVVEVHLLKDSEVSFELDVGPLIEQPSLSSQLCFIASLVLLVAFAIALFRLSSSKRRG